MTDKNLGTYHRTDSPDYMDGGVTSARIEEEADRLALSGAGLAAHFRARAEKAEEQVEDLAHDLEAARAEMEACDVHNGVVLPRPLTADDIPVMIERIRAGKIASTYRHVEEYYGDLLTIALDLSPSRPEGAEEIEAILSDLPDTMLPITDAGRADLLASRGVRVTGAE